MTGVLVNTAAVVLGSLFGLLCKRGIPEKLTRAVMTAIGLCTLAIGIQGVVRGENALVLIASMVIGVLVGTGLDLDGCLNRLGDRVGGRFAKTQSGASLAEGFVTASLLFCVGAMTVMGSLNAGVSGDSTLLYTKSLLDLISSALLAASLGAGVLCAAAVVFFYQGALVLLAQWVAPFLSETAILDMTCAGSVLIVALGLNLLGISKIKAADLLPAVFLAPVFSGLAAWIAGML